MGDAVSDERLMTYAELAELLGIQAASAKKRAQRRKWRRIVGNDGVVRVCVPVEAFSNAVSGDASGVLSPPVHSDAEVRIARLEGLLEGLRGELDVERRRADSAEARVRDIEGDRDAWRRQAQRSLWHRLFG